MLSEVTSFLALERSGVLVDGTVGSGGHAAELLLRSSPEVRLIGIDRDPEALDRAASKLSDFGDRVSLHHGEFSALPEILTSVGLEGVDGILLDLGVSSSQIERSPRGFSYMRDGPLDMRMNPERGPKARDRLMECEERQLAGILRDFGEEPRSKRIARAILERRATGTLQTTGDLREAVVSSVPARDRTQSLARTFQAIRIWVNGELEELDAFLAAAPQLLEGEGVLCIIAYHSLEDRRVKAAFRGWARDCVCPPELPVCRCGQRRIAEILTRRVRKPSSAEVEENPRSRSARLRACKMLRRS